MELLFDHAGQSGAVQRGESSMRKTFTTLVLAAGLATGSTITATPAFAGAEVIAEVVSDQMYEAEGKTPALEIGPVTEPARGYGDSLNAFQNTVADQTGLTPQPPVVERYEEIGDVIDFELLTANGEIMARVSRAAIGGDVPESVVTDPAGVNEKTVLSDKSTLVTSSVPEVDEDGQVSATQNTVSTLSPNGQLTVWSSDVVSLAELSRWATSVNALAQTEVTVDSAEPTPSENAASTFAAADASCQVIKSRRPFKHGASIQYDGSVHCNTSGLISLSVGVDQYRGLGVWRGKGANNRYNHRGDTLGLVHSWRCASGTGTQTYRGKMSASLRATSDTWMMPSSMRFSSEARITCG